MPFIPDNLLAKSLPDDGKLRDGCLLEIHTQDVIRAAKAILEVVEVDFQRFFQLTDDQLPCLRATVRLAAFCHDLGKANNSFQAMVVKKRKDQAIRHEHLSTLLMSLQNVRQWLLESVPQADFELARLIVLGHHLKVTSEGNIATKGRNVPVFGASQSDDDEFFVYAKHQDFRAVLRCLNDTENGIPEPLPERWSFYDDTAEICLASLKENIIDELTEVTIPNLRRSAPRQRLLWAARAVFYAADGVASGLRRTGISGDGEHESIGEWIKRALQCGKSYADIEKLIAKRKAEVEARERAKGKKGWKFIETDFQREMHKLSECALLLAPCGSGKTLAAYLWIKEQLKTRAGWKVVFLYPTTGTATEGFKDYASHDEDAALAHSRMAFDLDGMFENPDDERSKNNYSVDQRLYALGYWPDAIFSATVDAFLGFLQNSYSSLCLLPVLARSVIVIDEIHSFDYAIFDALLEFLRQFKAPVLLMTASLQKQRRKKLEREFPGMTVYPQLEDMKRLRELSDAADFPRYRITDLKSGWQQTDIFAVGGKPLCPQSLLIEARKAQSKGLKVLWVANTVDRCVKIAQELGAKGVFCYHSRFMYTDRVNRHREVIGAFQPSKECGVIAVATQVCEMSLDLNADLLIMELAPAPSLIQRMGRCNRGLEARDAEKHGRVFIYDAVDALPYTDEAWNLGREFLSALELGNAISQTALAETLKIISESKERGKRCLFTMPMWEAYSGGDFRDTDDFTVSAVLESRLTEFRKMQRQRDKRNAGLILQAPRRLCLKEKQPEVWLPVVPDLQNKSIKYDETYGLYEVRNGEKN